LTELYRYVKQQLCRHKNFDSRIKRRILHKKAQILELYLQTDFIFFTLYGAAKIKEFFIKGAALPEVYQYLESQYILGEAAHEKTQHKDTDKFCHGRRWSG
jgi:hypothetical protein